MEARTARAVLCVNRVRWLPQALGAVARAISLAGRITITLLIALSATLVEGASRRTPNFIVQADTQELADKIANQAEVFRRDLAIEWLGRPMPNWSQPCPIVARVAPHLGAGGKTSFQFDRGEVFGWDMEIQGSEERLLDSVLPHEITHTIFASYFRRPLPRWADEGACTTVEHPAEKNKQQQMLITFLREKRGIPFKQMFAMKEYPADILPLYAQGYSLARYLIAQGGKQKFMAFIGEGMQTDNWPATLRKHYGIDNLSELQNTWLSWVKQGSPNLETAVAVAPTPTSGEFIYRAQSEDSVAMAPAVAGDGQPSVYRNASARGAAPAQLAASTTPRAPLTSQAETDHYASPVDQASPRAPGPEAQGWRSGDPAAAATAVAPAVYSEAPPTPTMAGNDSPTDPQLATMGQSAPNRRVILEWGQP